NHGRHEGGSSGWRWRRSRLGRQPAPSEQQTGVQTVPARYLRDGDAAVDEAQDRALLFRAPAPPRARDDLETRRAALSRHSADLSLPDLDRRLSSLTIPTWQDGRRRLSITHNS